VYQHKEKLRNYNLTQMGYLVFEIKHRKLA